MEILSYGTPSRLTEALRSRSPELNVRVCVNLRRVRHRSLFGSHNSPERGGDRALKSLMVLMGVFDHHLGFKSLTKQALCAIYLPHQLEFGGQRSVLERRSFVSILIADL